MDDPQPPVFEGELRLGAGPVARIGRGNQEGDVCRLLLDRRRRLGDLYLDDFPGSFAVVCRERSTGTGSAALSAFGDHYLAYREDLGPASATGDELDLIDPSDLSESLDAERLTTYFSFQDPVDASTFFTRIKALLPGEMHLWSGNGESVRSLPHLRLASRIRLSRWEDYVERLAELLDAAVRRSVQGHVRASIWLSGGLDSTPIAALAARHLGVAAVEAVSWSVADPAADDGEYVESSSQALGMRTVSIACDDALPYSNLANWPIHPMTPEQTPYRWFHERCYSHASTHGQALVLNGFGGDQLYIHAHRWFWCLAASKGIGRAVDRLREVASAIGWWPAIRSRVLSPLLPKTRSLRRTLPQYLTTEARARVEALPSWPPDLCEARRPAQAKRLLSLTEARAFHFERWFAARHGLEVRSPLRDQDLVEFMLGVPDHLLHQGTESRPVLRDAIRDLVPESVWRRKTKASFASVLDRGLAPANLPWAKRLLLDADAIWRPFVQEPYLRRWLAGDFRDEWDRLGFIHCLNAELWRFKRSGGDLASLAAEH